MRVVVMAQALRRLSEAFTVEETRAHLANGVAGIVIEKLHLEGTPG